MIRMAPGMARLTVLGRGWSDTAIESGDGFTIDGEIWEDIATELEYDFGFDVDWDFIAGDGFDWTKVIYTDPEAYSDPDGYIAKGGKVYTDPDGDGIWTDPVTGTECPDDRAMWIPEELLLQISDSLSIFSDNTLAPYAIDPEIFFVSGPYGQIWGNDPSPNETQFMEPAGYYAQITSMVADTYGQYDCIYFNRVPFTWYVYNGGAGNAVKPSSQWEYRGKTVHYTGDSWNAGAPQADKLPPAYGGRADFTEAGYIAWQLLYGSFKSSSISKTDQTISAEDIQNGTTGIATLTYEGKKYYAVAMKQEEKRRGDVHRKL